MLLTSTKQIKNYYIFIMLIGAIWSFFLPPPTRAYGIVFMMLAGFPIFGINHFISFFKFSASLKVCDPFLFNSYARQFGPAKGNFISNMILFNEKDRLKKMKNENLQYYFGITYVSLKYVLYSFFSVILIAVLSAFL